MFKKSKKKGKSKSACSKIKKPKSPKLKVGKTLDSKMHYYWKNRSYHDSMRDYCDNKIKCLRGKK